MRRRVSQRETECVRLFFSNSSNSSSANERRYARQKKSEDRAGRHQYDCRPEHPHEHLSALEMRRAEDGPSNRRLGSARIQKKLVIVSPDEQAGGGAGQHPRPHEAENSNTPARLAAYRTAAVS